MQVWAVHIMWGSALCVGWEGGTVPNGPGNSHFPEIHTRPLCLQVFFQMLAIISDLRQLGILVRDLATANWWIIDPFAHLPDVRLLSFHSEMAPSSGGVAHFTSAAPGRSAP